MGINAVAQEKELAFNGVVQILLGILKEVAHKKGFAHKEELSWGDVTQLVGGTLGDADDVYLTTVDGIRINPTYMGAFAIERLHPNERVDIGEAECNMRLDFPCTPKELYDWWIRNGKEVYLDQVFVDEIKELGGSLSTRVAHVPIRSKREEEISENTESDTSLGRARREDLKKFAKIGAEGKRAERQLEWDKWKAKAKEIQDGRRRKASKRRLAELVKNDLNLPDSIEAIRKRI